MHQNKILCLQSRPKMSDLSRLCAMCDFCVLGIVNVNVKLFYGGLYISDILFWDTHYHAYSKKKLFWKQSTDYFCVIVLCINWNVLKTLYNGGNFPPTFPGEETTAQIQYVIHPPSEEVW